MLRMVPNPISPVRTMTPSSRRVQRGTLPLLAISVLMLWCFFLVVHEGEILRQDTVKELPTESSKMSDAMSDWNAVHDDTDLTTLVGPDGRYAKLVANCFTDKEDGINVRWEEAKLFQMEEFMDAFARDKPTRRAHLRGWIQHYGLEGKFQPQQPPVVKDTTSRESTTTPVPVALNTNTDSQKEGKFRVVFRTLESKFKQQQTVTSAAAAAATSTTNAIETTTLTDTTRSDTTTTVPDLATPTTSARPVASNRACGNGNVGNGVCADPTLCCSNHGWCGNSTKHCQNTRSEMHMLQTLTNVKTRYYIYDDPEIDQPARGCCGKAKDREAGAERLVLKALKHHPLRTYNPQEADLFVIPIGIIGIHWGHKGNHNLTRPIYDNAFHKLSTNPWFQKLQGHQHILFCNHWSYFDFEQKRGNPTKFTSDPMYPHYDKLWNVTWAGGVDRKGMETLYHSGPNHGHLDYQNSFQWGQYQMSRSTFSVGLLPEGTLPYREATYEKFQKSKFSIFYHTREEPCWTPHSTDFRKAPLTRLNASLDLPEASIGQEIPWKQWLDGMTSAQYCLVIRGDNPQTHALNRALKTGCLPVVVSDTLPDYAPTMRSSLNLKDYCIFIPEAAFLEDPLRELKKLETLSEGFVKKKLAALRRAQRVVLPDHPQSLFVPAFLRETLQAQSMARQEPRLQEYTRFHKIDGKLE